MRTRGLNRSGERRGLLEYLSVLKFSTLKDVKELEVTFPCPEFDILTAGKIASTTIFISCTEKVRSRVSIKPKSSASLEPYPSQISVKLTGKIRKYNSDYLEIAFTVTGPEEQLKPQCVICYESLSNECIKPATFQSHLETKQPEYKNYFLCCVNRSAVSMSNFLFIRKGLKDAVQGNATDVCVTNEMLQFYKEAYSKYKDQKEAEKAAKMKDTQKKNLYLRKHKRNPVTNL
ncbi:hypothetical protein JTE90_024724 [Oedothorax gibbosus]|uniref:Uncharacterized protein n=1 Tax=Oedothorax gibbosus TaxID=931172 RepID=A0AAV6UCH3_9ARAC|nr:hypothetical protein JTE90_024724 [Oedothorax gibbosus]